MQTTQKPILLDNRDLNAPTLAKSKNKIPFSASRVDPKVVYLLTNFHSNYDLPWISEPLN